ncbi:hypothetical protein L6452_30035 [Arctium lappa]|uniref:Uncharacterized protein n=1 Tax=Arctium lappa TaxID=4217 RepID=A0ACB8ZIN2_ARCLA|nr:hypothetical protein L6452_30035 [Arctium lappa]
MKTLTSSDKDHNSISPICNCIPVLLPLQASIGYPSSMSSLALGYSAWDDTSMLINPSGGIIPARIGDLGGEDRTHVEVEVDVAAVGVPKKRTFKKFSFRGVDLDALLDMSTDELVKLFTARARRRLQRGLKRKPMRVKFIADHLPDVVVLGALNVPCSRLKEDTYELG